MKKSYWIFKSAMCLRCGRKLRDRNSQDVMYCLPCFAIMQSDLDEEE